MSKFDTFEALQAPTEQSCWNCKNHVPNPAYSNGCVWMCVLGFMYRGDPNDTDEWKWDGKTK